MAFKKNRELRLRTVGNQRILMGLQSAFVVNASFEEVWGYIDGERGVDEITKLLEDKYESAPGEITAAVTEILDFMESEGAIVRA